MMQHLTTEEVIDYLHGALPPAQDARVYEHLETCEECRSEYNAEAALGEEIRAYARRTDRELPPMVKAQIWERIRQGRPARGLALWLRPVTVLPAAAVLAVGAYFGSVYLGARPVPAIAASYYLQDHAAMSSTVPFSDRASSPVMPETAQSGATLVADAAP